MRAEGDLDFRRTLGVDRDAPVGFRDIRLSFDLGSDASEEDLAALVATTERCWVVLHALAGGVPVTTWQAGAGRTLLSGWGSWSCSP